MPQKKYADTDFFLALIKESDWLKDKARKIYEKNKGNIYVTPFTVAEIMLICKRENIPIKEAIINISRIAQIETVEWEVFIKSCELIESGASIFDSLLMASCSEGEEIISSDGIYKEFGYKILDIKE